MFASLINPVKNICNLVSYFDQRLKKKIIQLSCLILICNFTELISIVSISPFLTVLSNPQNFISKYNFLRLSSLTSGLNNNHLIVLISFIFVIIILLSTLIKLITAKKSAEFCSSSINHLTVQVYRNYFNQPFEFYLKNDSKEIINIISTETLSLAGSLQNLIDLIISTS